MLYILSLPATCKRLWRRKHRFILKTAAVLLFTHLFQYINFAPVAELISRQQEPPAEVSVDAGPHPVSRSESSTPCFDILLERPPACLPCPHPQIDAVYTWANGSDPRFQRQLKDTLQQLGRTDETVSFSRFADSDMLRYSLRSLERYAPWVRHVYLVTSGQVPSWLNLDDPWITLVAHADIFPNKSHLPTFSSSAIEMHLHRIPGLSEHFLYFNDHLLLAQPVRPEDFVDHSGEYRVYLTKAVPSSDPQRSTSSESQNFLDRLFTQRYGEAGRHRVIGHVPYLLNKSIVAKLGHTFADEFARTSVERLRSPTSMQLPLYYFNFLMLERKLVPLDIFLAEVTSELEPDSAEVWRDADLRSLLEQLRQLESAELSRLLAGGVRQFRSQLRYCAADYASLTRRRLHTRPCNWPHSDPDPKVGSCAQLLLQLQLLPVTRPRYRYRVLFDDALPLLRVPTEPLQ